MNNPTYITIGLPFYNVENYLSGAIQSILAQTHPYWELILVDDGSTDKSLEIARSYAEKDDRIRLISDGSNKRLPARLNQIIKEAKYDYIARMDSDDLMSTDRIEKQLKTLIDNHHIDFVTTGCLTIGKNNELTGIKTGKNYQMSAESILGGLTNLLHASLLAKKEWYYRNTYNEKNVFAEDYELWLNAAKKNDLNYIVLEEPLYWYRVIENVTIDKLTKGYNSQIKVINNNYKGIISEKNKNKNIKKFKIKILTVKILDKLGLLNILLKRRSQKYNLEHIEYYNQEISIINNIKI
ncbi:glycosyltransferase family 2 protein [Advenella sp. WQ 585]|uniref:Glycosyltransferase family 2 protein n=1 Tax=Advenella mandrilli TaxID=2800330 RepID=A0ABS1ECS3_9BURK|nr:glycosyltransferase family A protein [Advenella mandrilli]MBK1781744.1 glycosyltransferase family 2 protein [Advenella mandrilli]